ncbi:MAG TPA: hypothetical protein VIM57_07300 [Luteolibacter sp.]
MSRLFGYLENEGHPNHLGYQVRSMRSGDGRLNRANFVSRSVAARDEINRRSRPGSKVHNLGDLHIVRFPEGSALSELEREEFDAGYCGELFPDGLFIAGWHVADHGGDDFNVIAMNSVSLAVPQTRRERGVCTYQKARDLADALTSKLNAKRRAIGVAPIIEMPDVVRETARKRRGWILEEELAKLPMPPTMPNELKKAVEDLGHETVSFTPDRDRISIRFASSPALAAIKKAKHKKRSAKGSRFGISRLLDAVREIVAARLPADISRADRIQEGRTWLRQKWIEDLESAAKGK